MKKNEAIDFIKECSKVDGVCGFFVIALTKEDLINHYDEETIEEFEKLKKSEQKEVLSEIANEMEELYKEWGFQEDMPDEIDFECYI